MPLNDVYDAKTYFNQTSAGVSYRKSARATATLIGEGFIVKRTSRAPDQYAGISWTEANYDYRLTRVDTAGAFYNYIRFEYPRIYGGSDIHGFGGTYSRRISRNWSVNTLAGLYHVETTGTQLVQLSPEIAAILGRASRGRSFQESVDSSHKSSCRQVTS